MARKTPMMEQYLKIKESCSDALLLFRLGDFYELFYEDAQLASQLLDLTLTGRGSADARMPMCGVPFHAADAYIGRLVGAGHKVAICDQVEDPKTAKGLVRREIVRVITPGTGYDFFHGDDVRLLIATVTPSPRIASLWRGAVVDPMTGDALVRDGDAADMDHWFSSLQLAELIVTPTLPEPIIEWIKAYAKRIQRTYSIFLGEETSDIVPAEWGYQLLVDYLRYTGKRAIDHVKQPVLVEASRFLQLTQSAMAGLELLTPLGVGRKNSTLIEILDFTTTSMGRRKLREMIERPFAMLAPIIARQDALACLLADPVLTDQLQRALAGMHDLARISSRISFGSALPRDLAVLAAGLRKVQEIEVDLDEATVVGELCAVQRGLHGLPQLADEILRTLVDDPPGTGREGGILRSGADVTVDHLRTLATGNRTHLAALEQSERTRTGIRSLKIAYNRVFGYYIEVTSANAHLVPADYERKQTLAGAERFVTPELRHYEQEILQADERIKSLEWDHFVRLLNLAAEQLHEIQETSDALGILDALLSLAEVAKRYHYCRPEVSESTDLKIVGGRHPVVERHVGGDFVPNDTMLEAHNCFIGLITGPNMAGKSTYMRQVALIILLAQMGSYVPAQEAHIGLIDKLFTRIGASDDVSGGLSTFMVEMTEVAEILREGTARSLIVLDEVGRGTSTYDGLSIAQAIVEYIHNHIGARTLFATHYHELTKEADRLLGLMNLSVAVAEIGDRVIFLHQIVKRPADRSYGIHVAQYAGLPAAVIERAKGFLTILENTSSEPIVYEQLAVALDPEESGPREQSTPVLQRELSLLNVDEFTPRQALEYLYDLHERARGGPMA